MTCEPARILIDCTHTAIRGLQTGVQRVVRSLVREGAQLGCEHGHHISGVVLGARGFAPCFEPGDSRVCPPPPALRDDVPYYFPAAYARAVQWLCSNMKSASVRRWLLPKAGHLGAYRPLVRLIEGLQRLTGCDPRRANELGLGQGDILILPDAYWAKMDIWQYVRALRANGVFVAVVIYDIIPLTSPQFVPPRFRKGFREYLRKAVSNADLLVAISHTICHELRDKLPALFPEIKAIPPVEAFCMGADFEDKGEAVRDEVVRLFSELDHVTPYLSVSTFDLRKNHGFTLAAFESLWSRGSDACLMFAGARGGMSKVLQRKIETHPELGKKLYVYHDLSDSELCYCYQRARGTISSSLVEGFNLPLVESLWHGRKTFASDTPIHREVGGNDVVFFSLASPQHLAFAIATWERELASGATLQQRRVKPMSWRESTSLLLERCCAAFSSSHQKHEPVPGTMRREPVVSAARRAA